MIGSLEQYIRAESQDTRSTIVSAFKFAVVEHADAAVEEALAAAIESVLLAINDAHVDVRKAAIRTVNFIIHNNASLLRHKLSKHLSTLFAQTAIKKELIREV